MPATLGILRSERFEHFDVPGFNWGDKVIIPGFLEPFESHNSNDIVVVSNGSNTAWVKPSRIVETYNGNEVPATLSKKAQVIPAKPVRMNVAVTHSGESVTSPEVTNPV
jgi:hypothetical protein